MNRNAWAAVFNFVIAFGILGFLLLLSTDIDSVGGIILSMLAALNAGSGVLNLCLFIKSLKDE